MRDFNQASLDEHLANLAQTLTPEQAEQVTEKVRQRASGGWFDLTAASIDGAFELVGAVLNGAVSLPGNPGGVGDRLAELFGALDPLQLGGIGNLLGSVPDLGGAAAGAIGELAGHAGDAAGMVAELAGNADAVTDILGSVLDAAPSAGELAGFILEAIGEVLSNP
jgi:hypothetical protein